MSNPLKAIIDESDPYVLRDAEGNLIFPSRIPPDLDVPDIPVREADVHAVRSDGALSGSKVGLSQSTSAPEPVGIEEAKRDTKAEAEGRRAGVQTLKEEVNPLDYQLEHVKDNTGAPGLPGTDGKAASDVDIPKTLRHQQYDEALMTGLNKDGAFDEVDRPTVARTRMWQTERPQPGRHDTIPEMFRRGTQLSALRGGVFDYSNIEQRRQQDDTDDDSSSSSSSSSSDESSDDENPPQHKRPAWTRGKSSKEQEKKSLKSARHQRNQAYKRFNVRNDNFRSKGKVSKNDGRLNISVNETGHSGYLAKALGASFLKHFGGDPDTKAGEVEDDGRPREGSVGSGMGSLMMDLDKPLKMNIVIMVIGSRGDIQPFLKLGKVLKEDYGHRVRIATHPAFRSFV
jgi:hypothetical protein